MDKLSLFQRGILQRLGWTPSEGYVADDKGRGLNFFERTLLKLMDGLYRKPSGGIPKGDLSSEVTDEIEGKQEALESGENIKTVNNQSILGPGNIAIEAGARVLHSTADFGQISQSDPIITGTLAEAASEFGVSEDVLRYIMIGQTPGPLSVDASEYYYDGTLDRQIILSLEYAVIKFDGRFNLPYSAEIKWSGRYDGNDISVVLKHIPLDPFEGNPEMFEIYGWGQ